MSEARQLQSHMQAAVLDMVRLYNLTLPTAENSYLYQSLNWTLFDTPLQGRLIRRRDISYVEVCALPLLSPLKSTCSIKKSLKSKGEKHYILSMTSTEIPGVDDLEHKYGIVRGELLHSGFLFIETDRPGVQEFLSMHHNRPNEDPPLKNGLSTIVQRLS
ncbi:unnamed protein product [Aphanomyces euteiches]|uniref:Uncharacterized protein n=1 Tax=Aphanomyces euteiches TaxID=100861 RepID=A0A6G0WKZ0_9STRA|nr:hypothetical protein Ae201684_014148 [Aphanomyces euteiches]KAH9096228.1 hypothetical protein Ae201684P_009463 [Aphanomyces euteiches]